MKMSVSYLKSVILMILKLLAFNVLTVGLTGSLCTVTAKHRQMHKSLKISPTMTSVHLAEILTVKVSFTVGKNMPHGAVSL